MTQRIIIFLFHKDWEVCNNHLNILRAFNPGVRIFGLFGGNESDAVEARNHLSKHFEETYILKNRTAKWKKDNTDLSVRAWYQDFGCKVEFDTAYILQWDILLFAPIHDIYRIVPSDSVGLTGITPISQIEHKWAWALNYPYKSGLDRIQDYVKSRYDYQKPLEACLGPGYCFPRRFLELYANEDIPEFGHDEIRLPFFARLLNFEIVDTGFYPKWFDPEVEKYFNADSCDIEDQAILKELCSLDGRRVFHPYRKLFQWNLNSVVRVPSRIAGTQEPCMAQIKNTSL